MILCCGEALIDMLPRTTTEGESAFAPYAGGAVFNTAIALSRLGVPVSFFSGLSTDPFGAILTDALEASKVDTSYAKRSDKPTTLAFVHLADGHATYNFYDDNTAGRMLTPADLPSVPATACFFGGISLVHEPCANAYEVMMLSRAESSVTMIDPNIRRSFITDAESYRARLARMMKAADIIKISDEDLEWISGNHDGAALLSERTSLVLLTRGAEGATVFTRDGAFAVPAVRAEVVDTVGAGDTFNAGVLAGLREAGLLDRAALATASEAQLTAAVALGAKAAAITVSRAGANPPWRTEV